MKLLIDKILHCLLELSIYIMFLLKKNTKYFFFEVCKAQSNLFMWWLHQLLLQMLFCDILRMIFNIDSKCGKVNFHKQRKQAAKYHHLGIAPKVKSI